MNRLFWPALILAWGAIAALLVASLPAPSRVRDLVAVLAGHGNKSFMANLALERAEMPALLMGASYALWQRWHHARRLDGSQFSGWWSRCATVKTTFTGLPLALSKSSHVVPGISEPSNEHRLGINTGSSAYRHAGRNSCDPL